MLQHKNLHSIICIMGQSSAVILKLRAITSAMRVFTKPLEMDEADWKATQE